MMETRANAKSNPHFRTQLRLEQLEHRRVLSVPGFYGVGMVTSDSEVYRLDVDWATETLEPHHLGTLNLSGSTAAPAHDDAVLPGGAGGQFYCIRDDGTDPDGLPSVLRLADSFDVFNIDQSSTSLPITELGALHTPPGLGNVDVRLNALEWSIGPSPVLVGAGIVRGAPNQNAIFIIDPTSCEANPVVDLGVNQSAGDIAFGYNGNLYASLVGGSLAEVDLSGPTPVISIIPITNGLDYEGLIPYDATRLVGFTADRNYYEVSLATSTATLKGALTMAEPAWLDAGEEVYGTTLAYQDPVDLGTVSGTLNQNGVAPILGQRWYQLTTGLAGTLQVEVLAGTTDQTQLIVYDAPYTAPVAYAGSQVALEVTASQILYVHAVGLQYDGTADFRFINTAGDPAKDFGDAPATYGTELALNGARHIYNSAVRLGPSVDSESNGQPNASATGDDIAGSADEDGVIPTGPFVRGQGTTLTVNASQSGFLDAWIDLNGNGTFDHPTEQFFPSEPLSAGANTLNVTIPASASLGNTFVRFRFSSAGGLAPTGLAMDGEVEDYMITIQQTQHSIGLYDPNAVFHVKNDLGVGVAPDNWIVWGWGTDAGFLPLSGDWDGDGFDSIGLYDPSAVFHVKNDFTPGAPDDWLVWGWGSTSGYRPIVGDWDGDGLDTIGLYSPTGTFSLKNDFTPGAADVSLQWGDGTSQNWLPVAGDWDGDGFDTVGLYAPNGVFLFKNDLTEESPVTWLVWGLGSDDGYLPIAGDWDGNGIDTIGLYDANAVFAVKNDFSSGGAPDDWIVWGWGTTQNWLPITGDWDGAASPLLAAGGSVTSAAAPLTQADLQPFVAEAIADWAGVGLATEQLEALLAVDFIVTDLPGAQLGLATRDVVYLDVNAAGHGWFLDATPSTSEEFLATNSGELRALDPHAVDRMDLLTVVSHELGHTVGLPDVDSSLDTLMSGTLETGVRREPGVAEIDALFAQL